MAYVLFFFSGLAGLIYEIIWGRQLVLIFGSTTHTIVAVVSAFLAGLAIGSLIAGKYADKLSPKKLIKTYALLELGVGATAALSLILIPALRSFYFNFSDGTNITPQLLIIKFIFASLIILIPTTLMGATLPILTKFLKTQKSLPEKTISYLYAINTFGGVLGVALSAFVLIELLGLRNSLLFAVVINILISLSAFALKPARPAGGSDKNKTEDVKKSEISFLKLLNTNTFLILLSFSLSGLIAIAYQILWTRVLTPTMGTVIYAFASILIVYLVGIALGSLIYGKVSSFIKPKYLFFALLEFGIGIFAILSVFIQHKFVLDKNMELLLVILPSTLLMGLTFPAVIALIGKSANLGKLVGVSYFSNTIGAIIGGYLSSFILIPQIGTSASIIFLAGFNFLIAFIILALEKNISYSLKTVILTIFIVAAFISMGIVYLKPDRLHPYKLDFLITEAQIKGFPYKFAEDEIATVFGFKNEKEHQEGLLIDGVATTHKVPETRLMAHIPLTLVENPKKVLIICFGMGSTYKTALKHNVDVTAVELVPSVPKNMDLFYPDATQSLNNPKGKIVINDGRNFAYLTRDKFDVVIIDPPPPFNTAGSTVLHSKEFYQDLSSKLSKGGIVNQWIYYYRSREDEISMAIKSFTEVFPYILAVEKNGNVGGLWLLGSYEPINKDRLLLLQDNKMILSDMAEFEDRPIDQDYLQVVGDKDALVKTFKDFPAITDDRPLSEYYLIRHVTSDYPQLVNENARKFIEKISKNYIQN